MVDQLTIDHEGEAMVAGRKPGLGCQWPGPVWDRLPPRYPGPRERQCQDPDPDDAAATG